MTTAVSMYSRVGGLALVALFLAHAPRDIVAAVKDADGSQADIVA